MLLVAKQEAILKLLKIISCPTTVPYESLCNKLAGTVGLPVWFLGRKLSLQQPQGWHILLFRTERVPSSPHARQGDTTLFQPNIWQ